MAKTPHEISLAGADRDELGNFIVWEKNQRGEYVQRKATGVDAREMLAVESAYLEKPKGRSQVSMSGTRGSGRGRRSTQASDAPPESKATPSAGNDE